MHKAEELQKCKHVVHPMVKPKGFRTYYSLSLGSLHAQGVHNKEICIKYPTPPINEGFRVLPLYFDVGSSFSYLNFWVI